MAVDAIVAIAALPVTLAVLWALLRSPVGGGLVAVPSDERWHEQPTPTFGGVGIFAGFIGGIVLALAVGAIEWSGELVGILAGITLVFAAGLVDDLRHLSPIAKLAAQIAAALIVLASGLNVEIVGNDVLAWAIGLLWLVGITNAFNLLDNMDGLAATLALVSCGYFAIDALTEHENETVLVLALSLGLACGGFLPFNLRPRRGAIVFMGDSGSLVLGFGLASLALAASWTVAGTTVATILLPLLVLAIPILDTTLVTIARLVEKRPVTQGGRDHTSHRLVYYGLSDAKAVLLLAIVSSAIGATALAYNVLDNGRLTAVGVLVTFVLLVQFGSFPRRARAAESRAPSRRCGGRSCSSRAGSSRCSSTSCSSARRSSRRTCWPLAEPGRTSSARSTFPRSRSSWPRGTSSSSLSASIGGSGASRPRETSSPSPSGASGPRQPRTRFWLRSARSGRSPPSRSSSSMPFCAPCWSGHLG